MVLGNPDDHTIPRTRGKEVFVLNSDKWFWGFIVIILSVLLYNEISTRSKIISPHGTKVRSLGSPQPAPHSPPRQRYIGRITQTGIGQGSGQVYIVIDNNIQCFFRDEDLSVEMENLQRFEGSRSDQIIVTGTRQAGHMPLTGHFRYDQCRIEGWR